MNCIIILHFYVNDFIKCLIPICQVTKNERKVNEQEASTSKSVEKLTDFYEENEVDGEWKTDSDKIYLFARNDPEKELWFHRLNLAVSFDITTVDEPIHKKKINLEEHNKFLKAYLAYMANLYELSNCSVLTDNLKKKEVSILLFYKL